MNEVYLCVSSRSRHTPPFRAIRHHSSVTRRFSRALQCLLLGQGASSSACMWRPAGRARCHASTSSPCARSPPTNSDSPPDPPGAQSRHASPAPLQDRNRDVRTDCWRTRVGCLPWSFGAGTSKPTWRVSDGRGGPDHGGEAVRRLAFSPLLLLFLHAHHSLQSQRDRGLAVGAGEPREEDASDALSDARRSCRGRRRHKKRYAGSGELSEQDADNGRKAFLYFCFYFLIQWISKYWGSKVCPPVLCPSTWGHCCSKRASHMTSHLELKGENGFYLWSKDHLRGRVSFTQLFRWASRCGQNSCYFTMPLYMY